MTTMRTVAVAALVVGGLGVGGLWWSRSTQGPKVDAYHAVQRPIRQTLLVTGRVAPPARVDLGAQVQSTVVEVLVDEGDMVEAGTLMATLADDEAGARLREAEAAVAEAAARLQRVQGVGRKVASERVEQARLALEEAEATFARVDLLFQAGSSFEADHDAARKARDTARSQLVAAQLEAAATGRSGADTATAAAALARAQANVEVARAGLERTRLRAPTAGQVLQRRIEVGQVVRPGDTAFQFASQGPLEVRVNPDEFHLGALQTGQQALVVVEAFPDRPLRAEVSRIAPLIDADRGTVEVRLALADEVDTTQLRPDMSATVEVLLGEREEALVLPNWLVRDLGTDTPWVMGVVDGLATHQAVSLGLLGADAVEIAGGLEPDAPVLPVDVRVDVGDPVRPRGAQPALAEP